MPKPQPGQTRRFAIDVGLHAAREAVGVVDDRIERIQNGRPTQLDPAPER